MKIILDIIHISRYYIRIYINQII